MAAADDVLTVLISVLNVYLIARPNCLQCTQQFTTDSDFHCFQYTMITLIVIFVVDLLQELVF